MIMDYDIATEGIHHAKAAHPFIYYHWYNITR